MAGPARVASRPSTIVPLTADLRRLHLTVSKGFVEKVALARTALSHALPGATTEQVLEAALDLLLQRQAQRRGLGKRAVAKAMAGESGHPMARLRRPHLPAPLERTIRLRDGNRCQYPVDSGGVCGSTWQVEIDHVELLALGGETSEANLRCLCRRHNDLTARDALGDAAHGVLAPPRRRR